VVRVPQHDGREGGAGDDPRTLDIQAGHRVPGHRHAHERYGAEVHPSALAGSEHRGTPRAGRPSDVHALRDATFRNDGTGYAAGAGRGSIGEPQLDGCVGVVDELHHRGTRLGDTHHLRSQHPRVRAHRRVGGSRGDGENQGGEEAKHGRLHGAQGPVRKGRARDRMSSSGVCTPHREGHALHDELIQGSQQCIAACWLPHGNEGLLATGGRAGSGLGGRDLGGGGPGGRGATGLRVRGRGGRREETPAVDGLQSRHVGGRLAGPATERHAERALHRGVGRRLAGRHLPIGGYVGVAALGRGGDGHRRPRLGEGEGGLGLGLGPNALRAGIRRGGEHLARRLRAQELRTVGAQVGTAVRAPAHDERGVPGEEPGTVANGGRLLGGSRGGGGDEGGDQGQREQDGTHERFPFAFRRCGPKAVVSTIIRYNAWLSTSFPNSSV
jgi:hypothetical protein